MSKILEIDLSDDRLISIAADMVDAHNYIGALKMLNKNAEISGNDADSYALYAGIYDDLGLYEECINGWFRFMDVSDYDDMSECYEGLAVAYMNLGDERYSAYYYNKLLSGSPELDREAREQIIKDFLSVEESPLKFAFPPKLADCSDIIQSGVEYMKAGDYESAVKEFSEVDEENEKYVSARNYIAMCKIIGDKADEAEQECLNILKRNPDDVQALTTLAAVRTEREDAEGALEIARKLLTLNPENPDEIYKIATVCCENKLHREAYDLFCRLSGDDGLRYDLSVLYFKAVSAYNSNLLDESVNAFDELVTVYPAAVTARYYYDIARKALKEGKGEDMGYFYRLPIEMRESSLKTLAAVARLSRTQIKKLSRELDLEACIYWCFDETDVRSDGELRELAAQVAVQAELDDIVRNLLLDAFLADHTKLGMLTLLAERNEYNEFGLVICNIFKRVNMQALSVGANKRKNFVRAYAKLVAHFSVINDENGDKFALAAEKLYAKLEREDRLSDSKDEHALAAAIYIKSKVREAGISGRKIYEFFDTDEYRVKKITGEPSV